MRAIINKWREIKKRKKKPAKVRNQIAAIKHLKKKLSFKKK
jgi:hypothetical protein